MLNIAEVDNFGAIDADADALLRECFQDHPAYIAAKENWSDESFESVQALEDFVVDSYGSRDPDVRQLFSPEKELRFKGVLKVPYFEISGERVRVRELPPHIQEVNHVIQCMFCRPSIQDILTTFVSINWTWVSSRLMLHTLSVSLA
jgi:hypothetical protein